MRGILVPCVAGCAFAFSLACGVAGSGARVAEPHRAETLVVAVTAAPRSLLPPYAVDLVAGQLCDQLYQRLAEPAGQFSTVGDGGYRPALASSWTWGPDSASIVFRLDTAARWHDGERVTSRDVRFTYALWRDPRALVTRPLLSGLIDSVTTPDARTAVVWARRRTPTLFHDVTYPVHVLPAHLLDSIAPAALATHRLSRWPVGSGPFRFRGWMPGTAVDLEAARLTAPTAPSPAPRRGVRRLLLRVFPSYDAALAALLTGEVDVFDAVRPHDLPRVARAGRLAVVRFPGLSYAMLQFNLAQQPRASAARAAGSGVGTVPGRRSHPVFGDSRTRRALAMGADRAALVENVLGGLGSPSAGPFTRAQATADVTLRGVDYDPARAGRLLDSAGWRPAADGVRRRGGLPLEFTITVPASSTTRMAAAVLLQQMFARLGARAHVAAVDHATMVAALERGDFDAALTALNLDPDPAGVRDAWGSEAARSGRGFNYGGYANPAVDAVLDTAAGAADPRAARAAYGRAYRQIAHDAPAVFLYEPVGLLVYDRRWRPAGVRPDAWWAAIGSWRR